MLLEFICSSLLQDNIKSEQIWKIVPPTQTFFAPYCLSKSWKCSWRREQLQYWKLQICCLCSGNAGITRAWCYTFFKRKSLKNELVKQIFPALLREVTAPGPCLHQTTGQIFLVLQSSRRCWRPKTSTVTQNMSQCLYSEFFLLGTL